MDDGRSNPEKKLERVSQFLERNNETRDNIESVLGAVDAVTGVCKEIPLIGGAFGMIPKGCTCMSKRIEPSGRCW